MHKTEAIVPTPRTLTLPSSAVDTSRVSAFHIIGNQKTQKSRPHIHSFFELLFVEEGEGWHTIGDRKFWAKPGDLFVIAPGEIHDPSGLDHANKWIIVFAADALQPTRSDADVFLMMPNELLLLSFLRTDDIETRHLSIAPEEIPKWLVQLQQLKNELCGKDFGFTEASRALLILLLIKIARLADPKFKKPSVQSRPIVTQVLRFIETNYHHPIGLQEVAKEVSLSPAYLTDLIRRETGRTVLTWIVERRMAEARCLLLETDQSVNQIAEAVGYIDPGHFIRLFRRSNGTTPQAWRQMHRI